MSDPAAGPYLATACLCERVLVEEDHVLSAIRIVDRVSVSTTMPAGSPTAMRVPVPLPPLVALISIKNGSARGTRHLDLRGTTPTGEPLPNISVPIPLAGDDDQGVQVRVNVVLQVNQGGIFWFDVQLDGELLTRMPLRVDYEILANESPEDR